MKNIQKIIIYIVLQFLYRGMKVLYKDDQRISKELNGWNQDKTIRLSIINGPSLTIQYQYLKGLSKVKNKNADIEITFNSISTEFIVFRVMISV